MIYFVRHGATNWNDNLDSNGNRSPKCQGRCDIPLNERGIKQAKETAQFLKGKKFKRVICSPLLRARQTCEIIYHGAIKVEYDDRVIERDFGEFEGLTRSEFDFYGFWNEKTRKKYKRAESLKDVKLRAYSLLKELRQNPDEDVLIVSHGGFGIVLVSYFNGVPEDGNYLCYEIPNGKPIVLDLSQVKL